MTDPVGLVEFLLQRMVDQIAPLRQVQAQAVTDWVDPADPRFPALSLARIVEADIAAKRRVIELHGGEHECREMLRGVYGPGWPEGSYAKEGEAWAHPSLELQSDCETLRLLAAPFSSHPDWQPEWSAE